MLQADLTIPATAADIIAATMERLGGIDALINAAGWHPFFSFLDMPEKDIDYTIQSELLAVIRLARAVLPTMIKQRSGRFITVGSDSGKVGNRGAAVSSAAHGGVISFTKSLAREYARQNVLANVVCGHLSGLLMRQRWPLALMLCADRVPIESPHLEER